MTTEQAPMGRRSTARDGWSNRLETYVTTHFGPVWNLVQKSRRLRRVINRVLVNRAILKMPTRPNPLSTMAPYTSWASLTDRTFDSRHLPPAPEATRDVPAVERVAKLLARNGPETVCSKSTVLFAYFAQWFTDGFLRSDRSVPKDPRKNASNHEIDLCQLYGLTSAVTQLIRSGKDGLLKSQLINGEEFPPYLCENGVIKPEFQGLDVVEFNELTVEQKNRLFAMGSDRVNTQVGFGLLNVLFFREHNRIARLLVAEYPRWDDERIFCTARNILNVLLIKIVVGEYINHIAPYHFKFFADPTAFPNGPWYRPNWMAIEFNLLYRWHSLIPSTFNIGERKIPVGETMFNNEILTSRGLGPMFEDASNQPAGRIGLFNTDGTLYDIEVQSILQAREVQVASYNDYRANCRFPRVTDFNQISADARVQQALRDLYGTVDRIEYYVGIFAEDLRPNSALPPLMGRMVGVDAFSQALTNPLLASRVFNEQTFSPLGMAMIEAPTRLSDLVQRNLPPGAPQYFVSLTRRDWRRSPG
ncbi:peroxidase family protein [Candidatus Protofrankia californiensis]|uniref:peroxidase family protein n=1 Tax=Candidatus Protofrankia californiensis TaxID=1839754 RepID=UPI0019CF91C9|nr:peroxidase family protein [Candidatus Protofrankia californiensis]